MILVVIYKSSQVNHHYTGLALVGNTAPLCLHDHETTEQYAYMKTTEETGNYNCKSISFSPVSN
jgi:hypothetical protein